MKKTFITFMLAMLLLPTFGQIHTMEHSLRIHAGSSNFWMGVLGTGIMASTIPYVEDDDEYNWVKFMPIYDWMVSLPSNSNPAGIPAMKSRAGYFDAPWEHGLGDGYAGLEYRMTNILSPVGLVVDMDYRNKGCKIGEDTYAAHLFSPSAALMIRFGDFKAAVRPVIEIGGGYDYVFGYLGNKAYDKDALKSGFFAKASLGLSIPAIHSMVTVQYQRDFYDFFDQSYSIEGTKPFDGYKRNNSYIMLKLSHFWNRQ